MHVTAFLKVLQSHCVRSYIVGSTFNAYLNVYMCKSWCLIVFDRDMSFPKHAHAI